MATSKNGSSRYTGQAYQLYSNHKLLDGSYVEINGPWDTFGTVTSSEQENDGRWLNQVRGVPKRKGETPVAKL